MADSCRTVRYILAFLVLVPLSFFASGCDSGGGRDAFERRCLDANGEICDQRYALCIAASCDPDTMDGDTIECGRCDADDGSCGYCYVFEGKSCSYNAPCSDVIPDGDVVYSTYSEVLSQEYGLSVLTCSEPDGLQAGCMDAECRLTGETAEITDSLGVTRNVPTAICRCRLFSGNEQSTLGGKCDTANCSSIWSTAGDHGGAALSFVPQCSD
ncbi:MAG TPA: hypothetical protein PKC29_09895 [Thermodesulfobacteriota bacterium]|nr:hypothetical protein [Thermodesulfobacteriota bacterium]